MDIQPHSRKNRRAHTLQRWSANIIVFFGIFLTIFLWYFLFNSNFPANRALPQVFLVLGISISLLTGITIRLAQVTQSRNRAYHLLSLEFKKEIEAHSKSEESKQKLEIALLQSQKLQAIGTLAGGIAHDFNNLIYAIKGYVEMARQDVPKDSLVHKNLGKVLEASQRGQDLTGRILAFGRNQQHFEFKPLHVESVLESVLSLLKPTIPSSVEIKLIGISDDHVILGDQTQLHQLMVNIINNAVDAMDGEGVITIHVSHVPGYCKIDISDTGHGMDQTTMERIYEPFFTTKEVGKGSGLGLSTAHTIIKEHKGEISVESQLGQGSTFTLLLPLQMENA